VIDTTRLLRWSLVIAYAGAIFWASSLHGPPIEIGRRHADKGLHFAGFFVFGALLVRAVHARGAPRTSRLLLTLAIATLYAASDELHQKFVPGRSCELADMIADAAGAAAGILVWGRLAIKHARLR